MIITGDVFSRLFVSSLYLLNCSVVLLFSLFALETFEGIYVTKLQINLSFISKLFSLTSSSKTKYGSLALRHPRFFLISCYHLSGNIIMETVNCFGKMMFTVETQLVSIP